MLHRTLLCRSCNTHFFMEQSSTVSSLINSRPFVLVYFIGQVGKVADKVADIYSLKKACTCNLLDASKKRVETSK